MDIPFGNQISYELIGIWYKNWLFSNRVRDQLFGNQEIDIWFYTLIGN